MGATRSPLDQQRQGDIRTAAIFTFVLAGLGILAGALLLVIPTVAYGAGAFKSELAILLVFGGLALLFGLIEIVLGIGIARGSRVATIVALVLAALSLLSNLVTTFSSGDVTGGLFGLAMMVAYLYVLVRAYQAISAAG